MATLPTLDTFVDVNRRGVSSQRKTQKLASMAALLLRLEDQDPVCSHTLLGAVSPFPEDALLPFSFSLPIPGKEPACSPVGQLCPRPLNSPGNPADAVHAVCLFARICSWDYFKLSLKSDQI
ncbi:hypothetical protein Y1Q_0010137 [Alligator mississippiensis]|uniref:Uncharacterized protein n=1 Tax=Alligator mississippiensis TaxID=8496 RepID=A0A151NFV5_ALLMI|nr:hypothetical protein Y1Q_0010137 [Alligator mississippiensis]